MNGPINIKGVTSKLPCHFGKRFLDKKGYQKAMKKILGKSDLSAIKKSFKEIGIKTNCFSTREPIKIKVFSDHLKKLHENGKIKNIAVAKAKYERMTEEEKGNLMLKGECKFNSLDKETKRRLAWNHLGKIVDPGAKRAAERMKKRDEDIRKVGDVGIAGFGTMEKRGDSTLWKRYKALKNAKNKNAVAVKKLKEITAKIQRIRIQARKKNSKIFLRRYGIPETKQGESAWKPKTLRGNSKANPPDEGQKSKVAEEASREKFSSFQAGVSVSRGSGSAVPAIEKSEKHEIPSLPFSTVGEEKEIAPDRDSVLDNKLASQDVGLEDDVKQENIEDGGQQFGFIDSEDGEVKLDLENE